MLILSLNDVSDIFPVQTLEGNFEAFRYRNRLYRSWNAYKTFAETLRACRAILDENLMCLITQEQGRGRVWIPLAEDSLLEAKIPAPKPTFMLYRGAKVAVSEAQEEHIFKPETSTSQPTPMMYRGTKLDMAQPQAAKAPNPASAGQMMYRGNKLFN
jgi:hypothetical protein